MSGSPTSDPARRMRVLHAFTVDMSVRFIRGQAPWLAPHGIDYEVVSSAGPGLDTIRDEEGVRTHVVPMLRRISPFADVVALARLIRLIRARRPDATHAHTPKAGLLLSLAAWICRVPVRLYYVHGVPWREATGLRGCLLRLAEWTACITATHVFCVSHSVRRALAEHRLCGEDRCRVLAGGSSNGVDAHRKFTPLVATSGEQRCADDVRARHGVPPGAPLAGFVGRVTRDKGIVELVEAWAEVRRQMPDAHLLIVGPDDATDPLSAHVQGRLAADPSIHLHGADWNTPPLYHAIDLLVLPTYREGFPNVLLEAGACALPVVATRVDGCVDAVVDGETGLLVRSHDSATLAGAMLAYFRDPALRRRHGWAARARVLAGFAQEAVWCALLQAYRETLGMPRTLTSGPGAADTGRETGGSQRAA